MDFGVFILGFKYFYVAKASEALFVIKLAKM